MTMDDKFLYQLREQPNSEFAKNLHQKITQYQSEPKWRLNMNFQTFITNKKVKLVWLTTLIMVSLLAVITITPVRALISSLLTSIAGQSFTVTEDYPGDNYLGDETIIEPQVMSLAEAITIFPHSIKLPTNIPSEYVLNEENVRVYIGENAIPFSDTIKFIWVSDTSADLTLRITDHDWITTSEIVVHDSVEEIFLDDNHPAAVIRGGWDADNKVWNYNDYGIRLRWSVDNLTYYLMGINREQLIEIALSTLE